MISNAQVLPGDILKAKSQPGLDSEEAEAALEVRIVRYLEEQHAGRPAHLGTYVGDFCRRTLGINTSVGFWICLCKCGRGREQSLIFAEMPLEHALYLYIGTYLTAALYDRAASRTSSQQGHAFSECTATLYLW